MKAAIFKNYGNPEVISIQDVPKPVINNNQLLIEVKASAANSADMRIRKADPFLVRIMYGLLKPNKNILGVTFSGVVVEKGELVNGYNIGDEVFGMCENFMGSYAQYMLINANESFALKPKNISHAEAATIPFGLTTAIHFLNACNLEPNQTILIYGASGAVGTAAIQLAKSKGAIVTAVCSGKNLEFVTSLGADNAIDYNTIDYANIQQQYDIVYETVNKTKITEIIKFVKNNGILILGSALVKEMITAGFSSERGIKIIQGTASVNKSMMEDIKVMIENGSYKPVVDQTFDLDQIVQAHTYLDSGRKKGNIAIRIQ